MNVDRFGLLGMVAFIIAVMGAWNFLIRTATERHRDNPAAQAAMKFF